MTVPLDRLYNFLDNVVDQDILIYRWYPHGSRLLEDLTLLKKYTVRQQVLTPVMVCHDQEPLNYFEFDEAEILRCLVEHKQKVFVDHSERWVSDLIVLENRHKKYLHEWVNSVNIHDKYILLHSEKNSPEINNYVDFGAIPVYYFSHALISLDWFRYANVDPLILEKNISKDFLIYQRAWSGTREYRIKFSEMLVKNNLYNNCLTSFNFYNEQNEHYSRHSYKNSQFKIDCQLENYYNHNTSESSSSADYQTNDYNQTGIEVVLETLFDDDRWHLTEKVFRPIACGQPFILAATPNSLEYLKSYGFKTFDKYIDEAYDKELDPIKRLTKIINLMQSISQLPLNEKTSLFNNLQSIANYNRRLFFSKKFYNRIINEYTENIKTGLSDVKQAMGNCFRERHQKSLTNNLSDREQQLIAKRFSYLMTMADQFSSSS
jgi:hypothetical protein